jgi:hypothetical protein
MSFGMRDVWGLFGHSLSPLTLLGTGMDIRMMDRRNNKGE